MKSKILILFMIIGLVSCKKYDEGPLISFRSKIKRLWGLWEIDKYIANGIDSTSYYNNYEFSVSFYRECSYCSTDMFSLYYKKDTIETDIHDEWSLGTDFEEIHFPYYSGNNFLISQSWEIKKLTYKEFNVEFENNSKQYRLEFKKTKTDKF